MAKGKYDGRLAYGNGYNIGFFVDTLPDDIFRLELWHRPFSSIFPFAGGELYHIGRWTLVLGFETTFAENNAE